MRVLFIALLCAVVVGCTTEVVVEGDATPRPTVTPAQESSLERQWVEMWTEDGSSDTEGRCIWDAMIRYYGSEEDLRLAWVYDDEEPAVVVDKIVAADPAVLMCFEY